MKGLETNKKDVFDQSNSIVGLLWDISVLYHIISYFPSCDGNI